MILSSLGIKEDKNSTSGYALILKSSKKIDMLFQKIKLEIPQSIDPSIIVNFSLIDDDTIIKQKEFNSSFTYNNTQSKFDLSQYQKNIELNLINEMSEKIFIYLRT